MGNRMSYRPVVADISKGYDAVSDGGYKDKNGNLVTLTIEQNNPPGYFMAIHGVLPADTKTTFYIDEIVYNGEYQYGLPNYLLDCLNLTVFYSGLDETFREPLMVLVTSRNEWRGDRKGAMNDGSVGMDGHHNGHYGVMATMDHSGHYGHPGEHGSLDGHHPDHSGHISYYVKHKYNYGWVRLTSVNPKNYVEELDRASCLRLGAIVMYISNYYTYKCKSRMGERVITVETDYRDGANFGYNKYTHAVGSPCKLCAIKDKETRQCGLSLPLDDVEAMHVFMPTCNSWRATLLCIETRGRGPLWFTRMGGKNDGMGSMSSSWKSEEGPSGLHDKNGIRTLMDAISERLNMKTCKVIDEDATPKHKENTIVQLDRNTLSSFSYLPSFSAGWMYVTKVEAVGKFPDEYSAFSHKAKDHDLFSVSKITYRDIDITKDLGIRPNDVYHTILVYYHGADKAMDHPLLVELCRFDGTYCYFKNTGGLIWKPVSKNSGSRLGYFNFQTELEDTKRLVNEEEAHDTIYFIIYALALILGASLGIYECYNIVTVPERSVFLWLVELIARMFF